ncbi:hypothetical protein [Streptomyces microflavus]|uniref:hypothetical protein n=1 Tax=Streptomyces microflavus TaxID=1919 RepID=UPI0033A077FC
MVEREERPRSTAGDPVPPAGPGDAVPPTGPGGSGTPPAGAPEPETYAALLAELGALLDAHEPHEVVVLLRAELERRELLAYSHGWRDAAAHFEPAVEAARTANRRTLRLVGRTPGRAAVIPFRQEDRAGEPRDAEHEDGLPDDAGRPHAEGPRGESRPEKAEPRRDRPHTGRPHADRPHTDRRPGLPTGPLRPARTGPGPEPALVPKSRNSRVPTIPNLPAPRLRLPPDGRRRTAGPPPRTTGPAEGRVRVRRQPLSALFPPRRRRPSAPACRGGRHLF